MTYKSLVFAAVCLTFVVVVIGAYVRLPDAGLGFPDGAGAGHDARPHWRRARDVACGLQAGLGVANVMMTLPMPVAVAHNGGAAALLVMMVVINFALSRTGDPP